MFCQSNLMVIRDQIDNVKEKYGFEDLIIEWVRLKRK